MFGNPEKEDEKYLLSKIFVIACFFVSVSFFLQGNIGYSLSDEGYIWYGVQRVLQGEVPVRDFMAYDPGRYYVAALLMAVMGDPGILSLRVVLALVQVVGLITALLLISRSMRGKNTVYLLVAAMTFMTWMITRHKSFDITVSILLVGVFAHLISYPTARRYFLSGIAVGLAAVFGRNHGVYSASAALAIIILLSIKREDGPNFLRAAGLWALGVVVGFAPILFMAIILPGFALAFWKSILFLFELKATNLSLPVPWPWQVDFAQRGFIDGVRWVINGVFFVAMLFVGIASIVWVAWSRWQRKEIDPVFFASSFLILPYAHYAFSRADVPHLAQNISPLLIACFSFFASRSTKTKWVSALSLLLCSIWAVFVFHPGWQAYSSKKWMPLTLWGDQLLVDPGTFKTVEMLRALEAKYAPAGREIIVVPLWPGAYATLKRKAPIWEICPLFPRVASFEVTEIERIKAANIGLVVVLDVPLDGDEALRFKNTHPLTNAYIQSHFKRIDATDNPAIQVYVQESTAF